MNRKLLLSAFFVMMVLCANKVSAQINNADDEYEQFMNSAILEYDNFREKCNMEYAAMLRGEWVKTSAHTPDSIIPQKQIIPQSKEGTAVPLKKNIITSEDIVKTDLFGIFKRAKPIDKIEEVEELEKNLLEFTFLGTDLSVRVPKKKPHLRDLSPYYVANLWEKFSKPEFNNLVYDCIAIRDKHYLCDWAYLHMLQTLSEVFYEDSDNEATLLTAFIYAQSGYKIRLASYEDKHSNKDKLILLYASRYSIFNTEYYIMGGEKYYLARSLDPSDIPLPYMANIHISKASMEKEMSLSLDIDKSLIIGIDNAESKSLQSERYPELNTEITVNKNLINFYNTYPRSQLGNDTGTQFLVYANTPLSDNSKEQLYPIIEKYVSGKSTEEALNSILNFCQTAFTYKVDDTAWGYERAFFADETLHYPFSDCEDRAILFARIVRDILKYEVVLLRYPGHLACAVKIDPQENIPGDYVIVDNTEYIVCDPTYINASIGETMPECKGLSIRAIPVN